MSLVEQLLPASYKGVQFLVATSSITGGQKTVKHVFPNSKTQVIEDLGKAQRVYSMQIFVRYDDEEQYLQNRDRLLQTLEQGGTGKLVHPLYGDVDNVKVTTFSIAENFTSVGEGRINVTFEISTGTGTPIKAQNTIGEIENLNDTAKENLSTNFVEVYDVNYPSTYTAAVTKLNESVDAFNDNTNFFQASADEIDAFSFQVQDFQNNITDLIISPQTLYDSVQSLFDTMGNIYPSVETAVDSLEKFFVFGESDIEVTQDTIQRIERTANNSIINDAIQSLALLDAYFNAAQIDYSTVEDVESMVDKLDAQYQKLVESAVLNTDMKDSLTDVRTNMQGFFDQQKLTAQQIITVETNRTSSSLLAYQYYGDSSKSEDILKLNNIIDPASIEGSVKIFTQ